MSAHNWWNANVEGSTIFMPVADVEQQTLAFLIISARSGVALYDDKADRF